jgi:hypothetical protein
MSEQIYALSPELKDRIHLYCALFGRMETGSLDVEEIKYLTSSHPSFLDYIVTETKENHEPLKLLSL